MISTVLVFPGDPSYPLKPTPNFSIYSSVTGLVDYFHILTGALFSSLLEMKPSDCV